MGLTVSIGKDNDELVDNLVGHDSLKNEAIEKIMRLVDRGRFMPENVRENAYKDAAWKADTGEPGFLHISAPCIYSSVLENLDIKRGMSFLNIGSGTGYLSTMVGFILGETGINHGVELYENIVNFANAKIVEFLNSRETSAFEWCVPTYFVGNAFQIEADMLYDRIYCGALVPESHRAYFCSFLKIGGVLIMPYGHALQRIVRITEREFHTRDISAVTFSHLVPMNPEKPITNQPVRLPKAEPINLQQICRNRIRKAIRDRLLESHNVEMRVISTQKNPKASSARTRPRMAMRVPNFPRPILVFERENRDESDDEEEGEEHENREENNERFDHARMDRLRPQLFAMIARDRFRDRFHRHFAARARQAAQNLPAAQPATDSSSDSEGEHEQVRHTPYRQGEQGLQQQQQFYHGPDDAVFGYQFIMERDLEDEEHHDLEELFAQYEGGEIEHNGDEPGQLENPHAYDEAENGLNKSDKGEEESEGSSNQTSASFATAKTEEFPMIDTPLPNEKSTAIAVGEATGNGKTGLNKRQRTFTTSSGDTAPQAKKIQRKSTITKKDAQNGETEPGEGSKDASNDAIDKIFESEASSSTSSSSSSSSTTTTSAYSSISNNTDEKNKTDGISSEEQASRLDAFHQKFMESIESLPLTVQMRKYMKYEM